MTSWHSYPSVYQLGHAATAAVLAGPVYVEEKIDGSQFSFGVFDGVLRCRSKNVEPPADLFDLAVATAQRLAPSLRDGWTYRGEYLRVPRHNGLAYSRVPRDHVIIFDINPAQELYLGPDAKRNEAERLGLECVPVLFEGVLDDPRNVREFLPRESVLGGQLIEGVVVKPAPGHMVYGPDKKAIFAKYVSEAFKETQQKTWREDNPKQGDIIAQLVDDYATPARWAKAVQHLRDDGQLEDSPRDIGALIAEVQRDVFADSAEDIRDRLFAWALPQLRRALVKGLPEWYKARLAEGGA